MPATRRYRPSVAPVTMIGTVCTPGQIFSVVVVTAASTSGRIGEAGLAATGRIEVIETCSSLTTCFSADSTYSGESSGSTRQLTVAAASCGRAFMAWPPSSSVATQVVRRVAFQVGEAAATFCIASVEPAATAARSFLIAPVSIFDICRKYAVVTLLVFSG